MKILLVDDDPVFRSLTVSLLKRKIDAEITEVENGSAGITSVQRDKPDLIILDNDMPVMNGYQFLGRLRSDKNFKNIPVIVMTAANDKSTISKYINLDVSEYILKPFDAKELVMKIERASVSRKKNVLLIDDNVAFQAFIKKVIASKFDNLELTCVNNGLEGLNKLEEEYKPDLILLDFDMPEMTGYEFLKQLRSKEKFANLHVIMLTSMSDRDTIRDLSTFNVSDYLLKPVGIQDFSDKIKAVLN